MAYFNEKKLAMFPRITVNNGLRLINKVELPSDAKSISFSVDIDGKPFSCQTIYIAFDIKPDFDTVSQRGLTLRVATDNYKRFLIDKKINFDTSLIAATGMLKADFIGGITTSELKLYEYNGKSLKGTGQRNVYCSVGNYIDKPITNIALYLMDYTANMQATLKAGTKIEIWGCDYDNLS